MDRILTGEKDMMVYAAKKERMHRQHYLTQLNLIKRYDLIASKFFILGHPV